MWRLGALEVYGFWDVLCKPMIFNKKNHPLTKDDNRDLKVKALKKGLMHHVRGLGFGELGFLLNSCEISAFPQAPCFWKESSGPLPCNPKALLMVQGSGF